MTKTIIAEYDYVKGLAILSVILLHTVSYQFLLDSYAFFHIWQAVPLFILISYILIFSKLDKRKDLCTYYSKQSIYKIVKRIAIPYILFQSSIFILSLIRYGNASIYGLILGNGPGAYYPFIYIQIWLTAPFLFYLLNKLKLGGGGILLFICIILNLITSNYLQNEVIYSRLLVRYLFISYLAYLWIKGNYKYILFMSVLSVTYYFAKINYNVNFEPLIDNRWSLQQLPSFFYTLLFFVICYKLYPQISKHFNKTTKFIEWCGQNSYEIFLLQMFILNYLTYDLLILNSCGVIGRLLYILLIMLLSIIPINLYKYLKKQIINLFS